MRPQVKPGYKSTLRYDHANLLRTVCDAMGFSSCPGAAAVANPMSDFYNVVNIAVPFPGAAVASPVHMQATTSNTSPVIAMAVYVDNALKYMANVSSVNTQLPMSLGKHYVVAQSWDTAGGIHKRGIYVNVQSEAVVVTNPAPNAVVQSPVQLNAIAGGQTRVSKVQLYIDGNPQVQSSGSVLNTSVPLAIGGHTIAVQASDSSGNLTTNKFSVTSASPAVQILSPAPNSSFHSPMYVSAKTVDPTPVVVVAIYVDNTLVYLVRGTGVQTSIPLSTGTHWVVVQEWNQSGAVYKKGITVNVVPLPITISSPTANATLSSPVTIKAAAPASSAVQTMLVYIDNVLKYQVSGQTVDTSLPMSPGQHRIVAQGWDEFGNNWYSDVYVNVQ